MRVIRFALRWIRLTSCSSAVASARELSICAAMLIDDERVAQVVPHDRDEPFPQRGRLFGALPLRLGGLEELRVVHRRGCAPCQLLRKDQVMLVVDPRRRRCEDDHGEGATRPG